MNGNVIATMVNKLSTGSNPWAETVMLYMVWPPIVSKNVTDSTILNKAVGS